MTDADPVLGALRGSTRKRVTSAAMIVGVPPAAMAAAMIEAYTDLLRDCLAVLPGEPIINLAGRARGIGKATAKGPAENV